MIVRLRVQLEGGATGFEWWADSDEMPCLDLVADRLPALIEQGTAAIQAIAGADATITSDLAFDGPTMAPEVVAVRRKLLAVTRETPQHHQERPQP